MKRFALLALVLILLAGCMFEGNVYVSIIWHMQSPVNIPDSITHNIPNLPTDLNVLKPGAYYQTLPGDYFFQTDYGGVITSINIELSVKKTSLGVENSYFDIVCHETRGPYLNKVPAY